MTNKKLIAYCTTHDGRCDKCVYSNYCKVYIQKYGVIPLDEDEWHPERFDQTALLPSGV